jgi:hypothetical protein
MIEIKLEEASTLPLEMHIEGDVKKDAPQLRFSVISEGLRYSFGSKKTGSGYEVEFPVMEGKLKEGTYEAEIEVIVDGKHFVALTETVKFTKEVKPTVKLSETVAAPTGEPSAVKLKLGAVATQPKKPMVEGLKGLLTHAKIGDEISTEMTINGLSTLVEGKTFATNDAIIYSKEKITEAQVLAALKMVEGRGTDLDILPSFAPLAKLSENVKTALANVLRDKGISTRTLKTHGLL